MFTWFHGSTRILAKQSSKIDMPTTRCDWKLTRIPQLIVQLPSLVASMHLCDDCAALLKQCNCHSLLFCCLG